MTVADAPSAPSMPGRLESAWRQFWFAEIPPHTYALVRMLIGLVGVATIAGAWDRAFWDVDGLMPVTGAWGYRGWLLSHGLAHIAGVLVRDLLLIVFACMTVGFRTGIMVPLAFFGSAGMLSWNILPFSAAQQLLHELPFCLMFVDSGSVWSVDAWQRARGGQTRTPRRVPMWPLRLMQFQLALLYLSAGLWKMGNATWRSGLALHYVLNNHTYQRIPGDLPAAFFIGTVALTYLTVIWELAFPFLVWFRLTRPAMLAIGVFLHLGMFVSMEVGAFTPTVLIPYLAFLDPERTEARVQCLLGWLKLA
jgi:hypothetical protein